MPTTKKQQQNPATTAPSASQFFNLRAELHDLEKQVQDNMVVTASKQQQTNEVATAVTKAAQAAQVSSRLLAIAKRLEIEARQLRVRLDQKVAQQAKVPEEQNAESPESLKNRLDSFLQTHFGTDKYPTSLLNATKNYMVDIMAESRGGSQQIRYDPAVDRAFGGSNSKAALEDLAGEEFLMRQIVPTIYVYNPMVLNPYNSSNAYKLDEEEVQQQAVLNGRYFGKLWCKICSTPSHSVMCRSEGRWHFRMCYDNANPAIFLYKLYSCRQCEASASSSFPDDAEYNTTAATRVVGDSDSSFALCKLEHYLKHCAPDYLRELCPVILSKKCCFTKTLQDETRETCLTKSNCHEFSVTLARRYADSHTRLVRNLHNYVRLHQENSNKFYEVQEQVLGSTAIDTQWPSANKWAGYLSSFREGKYAGNLCKPLFPSPSDTYLRSTILIPHLDSFRNLLERLLETIQLTQIASMDSSYHTLGKATNASGRKMFRSSYEMFNELKQCMGVVFAESDSYAHIAKFLENMFGRKATFNKELLKFYLYTDRCCMDGEQLRTKWLEANPNSKAGAGLEAKLDCWHFLHRLFFNNNLRLSNNSQAAENRQIFSDFRSVIMQPSKSEVAKTFKNNKHFVIRDGETLRTELLAKLEHWKLVEELKPIVESDKFKRRFDLQVKHLCCLSDPEGIPMYKANPMTASYMCKRGTNGIENFHKQMNALIASSASMSPRYLALLLNLMIYRHNLNQHNLWVEGPERGALLNHGNPLLLRDAWRSWNSVHGVVYANREERLKANPYGNSFYNAEFLKRLDTAPTTQFFERYTPTHSDHAGSHNQKIPVPGWPSVDQYSHEIFCSCVKVDAHRIENSQSQQESAPIKLRLAMPLANDGTTSSALFDSMHFPTNPQNSENFINGPTVSTLQSSVLNVLSNNQLSKRPAISSLVSNANNWNSTFSVFQLREIFKHCCDSIDDVIEPPHRTDLEEDDLLLLNGEVPDHEHISYDEWFLAFSAQFNELLQTRHQAHDAAVHFILQKLADVTTCPVVTMKVSTRCERRLSPDVVYFIPQNVDFVQRRSFPSKFFLIVIDFSRYSGQLADLVLYPLGSFDCKFNKYKTTFKQEQQRRVQNQLNNADAASSNNNRNNNNADNLMMMMMNTNGNAANNVGGWTSPTENDDMFHLDDNGSAPASRRNAVMNDATKTASLGLNEATEEERLQVSKALQEARKLKVSQKDQANFVASKTNFPHGTSTAAINRQAGRLLIIQQQRHKAVMIKNKLQLVAQNSSNSGANNASSNDGDPQNANSNGSNNNDQRRRQRNVDDSKETAKDDSKEKAIVVDAKADLEMNKMKTDQEKVAWIVENRMKHNKGLTKAMQKIYDGYLTEDEPPWP